MTSKNAGETRGLGIRLASFLTPGIVIGFEGPLGAGKTTLIQGICEGLGITEKVSSPTFVLMHLYEGKFPVYHFDLYRLEPNELEDLGWEEYLEGDGVSLVEWVDRAKDAFQFPHLRISIDYGAKPDCRIFRFEPKGCDFPWLAEFFEKMRKR